nr:MAG TPA: hypothetical protein [Caudoviricetes sp.]
MLPKQLISNDKSCTSPKGYVHRFSLRGEMETRRVGIP